MKGFEKQGIIKKVNKNQNYVIISIDGAGFMTTVERCTKGNCAEENKVMVHFLNVHVIESYYVTEDIAGKKKLDEEERAEKERKEKERREKEEKQRAAWMETEKALASYWRSLPNLREFSNDKKHNVDYSVRYIALDAFGNDYVSTYFREEFVFCVFIGQDGFYMVCMEKTAMDVNSTEIATEDFIPSRAEYILTNNGKKQNTDSQSKFIVVEKDYDTQMKIRRIKDGKDAFTFFMQLKPLTRYIFHQENVHRLVKDIRIVSVALLREPETVYGIEVMVENQGISIPVPETGNRKEFCCKYDIVKLGDAISIWKNISDTLETWGFEGIGTADFLRLLQAKADADLGFAELIKYNKKLYEDGFGEKGIGIYQIVELKQENDICAIIVCRIPGYKKAKWGELYQNYHYGKEKKLKYPFKPIDRYETKQGLVSTKVILDNGQEKSLGEIIIVSKSNVIMKDNSRLKRFTEIIQNEIIDTYREKDNKESLSQVRMKRLNRKGIIRIIGEKEYRNFCWNCRSLVTEEVGRCPECGWYKCSNCGSCSRGCTGKLKPKRKQKQKESTKIYDEYYGYDYEEDFEKVDYDYE